MYLRQLKINGFKSFAGKVTLDLEPGLTAIVGPNGSGKSNIADAIKWALGEQSAGRLRHKKNEELIFAGTEKRAKASLAEVTLLFDNSDGQFPIDFSEVQISRRLYRSGESDYLLNGQKVKFGDVHTLLLSAGIGVSSYAVVGQGAIDSLILASPSERKLLFDEASGIRQHELKRENARKKITATMENAARIRDILGELAPRLRLLERDAASVRERDILSRKLSDARQHYLDVAWAVEQSALKHLDTQIRDTEKNIAKLEQNVAEIERERSDALENQAQMAAARDEAFKALQREELERDKLNNDLSVKRAELQYLLEKQSGASPQKRIDDVAGEIIAIEAALKQSAVALAKSKHHLVTSARLVDKLGEMTVATQKRLESLRDSSSNETRREYVSHALGLVRTISGGVNQGTLGLDDLKLLVYKLGRLLSYANRDSGEDRAEIARTQQAFADLLAEKDQASEVKSRQTMQLRSLEMDIESLQAQLKTKLIEKKSLSREQIHTKQLEKTLAQRRHKLSVLEEKLATSQAKILSLRKEVARTQTDTTSEMFGLATRLEQAKTELKTSQEHLGQLLAGQTLGRENIESLQDRANSWGMTQEESRPVKELDSTEIMRLERIVFELEGSLNALPNNTEVIEEQKEVSQRYHSLEQQLTDLEAAKIDLEKLIKQLEDVIKRTFEAAFAQVNTSFKRYFVELFGGGKAGLELYRADDGSYGIEIMAMPPGKRIETLGALSGGERSLAGVALLSAILDVRPAPFIVLDEVDAALDEVNSGRLGIVLRALAASSQLLVITHNRQTMAAASALFGVTMDQGHASKLLSVRLEEAREMAEA